MLGLLDLLANGVPKMPPRAEAAVMEKGLALIKFLAEEERRKSESDDQSHVRFSIASCTRFSLLSSSDVAASPFRRSIKSSMFVVPEVKRIPPDLNAATLSFPARLLTYVRTKCCGSGQVAYTRSGVSKQIYSRIIAWDDEKADKKTVMKFCIGLQLEMPEAELLMKSAGYAFSNTIPLDRAFTFAIENRIWNIEDVNEMLTRNGLPDLGLKF